MYKETFPATLEEENFLWSLKLLSRLLQNYAKPEYHLSLDFYKSFNESLYQVCPNFLEEPKLIHNN